MEIQRNIAAVDRLGQLLDEQPDVRDIADALALSAPPRRITIDKLTFSYGDQPVLEELSFEISAGETIGIAGPSGSGKTTLLGLVARFYDPTSGAVRFDGTDLRAYRLQDVYHTLAIVTQEPFLFATSVRDNIRCGRPGASDAEVEAAARLAEIHDEILALPQGYGTALGIGGRIVSGGQAQRINVARAILKNAPLLLLDEATSSLDSIAEAKVQRAIDRLMEGRTSLIVAHRLSTLRHADRILVLDRGKAVGLGSHEALLRDCPLYRQMWETQLLGEAEPRPARPAESAGLADPAVLADEEVGV
jgi:ABC-type multidrug transport system fused ATPase/permease subunit